MRTSDGKRDSTYGAALLALRTAMALSRAELANSVGVSRQAVGEWERGRRYPKTEHLKALIALAVKSQAFAAENEAEEIRLLWNVAHQKMPIDERWLSALLQHSPALGPHIVPPSVDETSITVNREQRSSGGSHHDHQLTPQPLQSGPHVDWGDATLVPIFYGREQEMAQLSEWVLQERARVVSVLGMGGIGKSALSVSLMYQVASHFEVVIWRSLRDAPSCEVLLDDCLRVFSPQRLTVVPATLEQRIGLLLLHLRKTRVLMVLDNLESLLEIGDTRGHFRPGYGGYRQLLHRVAETGHQGCLLLTSRERPAALRELSGRYLQVRTLRLAGLDCAACQQLFMEKEITGTERDAKQLIEIYGGNPLALKIVAETIIDLFGGMIGEFLVGRTVIFGSITELLDEQFARISALEQSVLYWLAIVREPVTLDELHALLVFPLSNVQLLAAVDALLRRSLIEPGKRSGSFTLQSVVLEYVTGVLIAEASHEIQQRHLNKLIQYGLELAHAKEYVRQAQQRLLVCQLLTELQSKYPGRAERAGLSLGPVSTAPLEEHLLSLLNELREENDDAQGYGPANLIALLRSQRGHLSGLDLSQLSIRGAYLQSIQMQDTKLCGSLIRDTIWTESVSATWAVSISLNGSLWAAGSMQGKVRVWDEGGQTLRLIWQAHTDPVQALAFSPDGQVLASGSYDGTLKLWEVKSGALLWTAWQHYPLGLAFSPDGSQLASGGLDATVRIWDWRNGVNLQTLAHPGHVFAVAFSPDGSLLASSCFDGETRLWERQKTAPTTGVEMFLLQTSWVTGSAAHLAFDPSGRSLVSANWDRTVNLWEVRSLRLLHKLPGKPSQVAGRVAWSPDGCTLAIGGSDQTIRLWDVKQGRVRSMLCGHSADIYGMAFTPDSRHLLSGSGDSALRVWDVETAQCIRTIAGYAVSLYDIDWSPDSMQLASGGTDGLVTIWDQCEKTPPKVLRGHPWALWGVSWSPDGRFVASSGWDPVLRLWDPTTCECRHRFEESSNLLLGVAWSPDGSLLASGTYLQGMQVWDVTVSGLRWVGQPYQVGFLHVAWSPDGTQLAAGSDDGNVYLWSRDGTLLQSLPGHQGRVNSVAWSPDGTRLASGSGNRSGGELFVWDVERAVRVQTFAGSPGTIHAVVWIPGENRLMSGGSDGMLRWWDVETAQCVSVWATHHEIIRSLKVSPDGKFLASCGDDGAIMIWDLTSHTHLRTLRRDRPYERLNITGIRGLTEAEIASLRALGAIEEETP